ncbi:MAG: hypothetical protein GXO43_01440 [Crenarchaeota archaeon]|nr:hypothetical protein [Thermoproteota archaeon]
MSYNNLYSRYIRLEKFYNNIKPKIEKVIEYAKHAKDIESFIATVIPSGVNIGNRFSAILHRRGYVSPGNFVTYSLGTLHEGDIIRANVKPSYLIIAIATNSKLLTYRAGSLQYAVNSTQPYYIIVYCPRYKSPTAFSLTVNIYHDYNARSLLGNLTVGSVIAFYLLRVYNYWLYNVRPIVRKLAHKNITKLALLYATSLAVLINKTHATSTLLRLSGTNSHVTFLKLYNINIVSRYVVVGAFPTIVNNSLNLTPKGIIPVVVVNITGPLANCTLIEASINDAINMVSEFVIPYRFIWTCNSESSAFFSSSIRLTFYIDTISVAMIDLNKTEAFIPFNILYIAK